MPNYGELQLIIASAQNDAHAFTVQLEVFLPLIYFYEKKYFCLKYCTNVTSALTYSDVKQRLLIKYRVNIKSNPLVTIVDISATHADFCTSVKHFTANFVGIRLKMTRLCCFNEDNPHLKRCRNFRAQTIAG